MRSSAGPAGGSRWRDRRGRASCSCPARTHRPVVREDDAGESSCGQRVERADALLQQLPGHLKNRLRKSVIETQLVRAGGVVDNELSRGYDGFAAILKYAVHAIGSQRYQHEIFVGAGDPGRRAQTPAGRRSRLACTSQARSSIAKPSPKMRRACPTAIEPDKDIADDVLPHCKSSIRRPKNWCRALQPRWTSRNPRRWSAKAELTRSVPIICRSLQTSRKS